MWQGQKRSLAQFVSDLGIECLVPPDLTDWLYGYPEDSDPAHCDMIEEQNITFSLIHPPADMVQHALSNSSGLPKVFSAVYDVPQCRADGDCQHGGECVNRKCRCTFGWCGAYCSSPAGNVCALPTKVSRIPCMHTIVFAHVSSVSRLSENIT